MRQLVARSMSRRLLIPSRLYRCFFVVGDALRPDSSDGSVIVLLDTSPQSHPRLRISSRIFRFASIVGDKLDLLCILSRNQSYLRLRSLWSAEPRYFPGSEVVEGSVMDINSGGADSMPARVIAHS